MKKYLLDSDIITYLEEKNSPLHAPVISRLARLSDDDEVYISVLTIYEMQYGIAFVKEEPGKHKKFLAVQDSIKRRFQFFLCLKRARRYMERLKPCIEKIRESRRIPSKSMMLTSFFLVQQLNMTLSW